MTIFFTKQAQKDYETLKQIGQVKLVAKIKTLLEAINLEPYSGIGKPEPLKHNLSGFWSRRIDSKHQLVYTIEDDKIIVISCMFHYDPN
jgi:toxin YoeB